MRDLLDQSPGVVVDLSSYGAGLTLTPGGRTARLTDEAGVTVVAGGAVIDDNDVIATISALMPEERVRQKLGNLLAQFFHRFAGCLDLPQQRKRHLAIQSDLGDKHSQSATDRPGL